jgi:hypothetical protein
MPSTHFNENAANGVDSEDDTALLNDRWQMYR